MLEYHEITVWSVFYVLSSISWKLLIALTVLIGWIQTQQQLVPYHKQTDRLIITTTLNDAVAASVLTKMLDYFKKICTTET
jgi:uncharacterized membrane protein